MKRCPDCRRTYDDQRLKFCRIDGTALVDVSDFPEADETVDLSLSQDSFETRRQLETAPVLRMSPAAGQPSIAVLPFVNMSTDRENEYFCDGLAEELLNALAKLEGLKVAARTSAFSFKGKDVRVSDVGRALNVTTVLEGSVRKLGNRLRIMAQLINVADEYHLWSERYDRQMEDVFDIQDEITFTIVNELKIKLLGAEKTKPLKRHTANAEAYEAYLRGRYYLHKFTVEDWNKALTYFEDVIDKEPEHARAYASTALCWSALWYYGSLPPHEIVPQWKAAASRAVEIDDDLAEAHFSLANILFYYDWDPEAARREFKRAIELNPNSADAHLFYGLFLAAGGTLDEAIKQGERAIELDPLSPLVNVQVGWIYWLANNLDSALAQAHRLIDMDSDSFGGYWLLGGINLARGRCEDAIEAYQKSVALGGGSIVQSALGCAYGIAGKRDEALKVLNHLVEIKKQRYLPAFDIARIYKGLGQIDLMFEWLGKACEERNGELVFLDEISKVGTGILGTGASDQRVLDLLRRKGLKA